MTTFDLIHRKVRFEPELDLESIAELPGKDVVQDAARRLDGSGFIQDSDGWCFYVRADDGRKYLVELVYVATERDASSWVLTCSRCAGLRAWEWFGSQTPNLGREKQVLDRATEIFVSHHGYERVSA
jgi:hypothetical protein